MSEKSNICIIDYGMGNLRSVQRKVERVGASAVVSNRPEEIAGATKLILPGVGHFANGIRKLKQYGIWDILNMKVLEMKTPVLGICLGMQLMAEKSEEGNVQGLGWFEADVVRFSVEDKIRYKVPHIGWNTIVRKKTSVLLDHLTETAMFYFVHSYHIICRDTADILTTTEYGYPFTSAIQKENIYGTQFHPEKSHDFGETLLSNFIGL